MAKSVYYDRNRQRLRIPPERRGLGLVTEYLGRELDLGSDLQSPDLDEADSRESICIGPDWAAAVTYRIVISRSAVLHLWRRGGRRTTELAVYRLAATTGVGIGLWLSLGQLDLVWLALRRVVSSASR